MDVVERWVRHLRATGRQPRTVVGYRSDVEQFRGFVGATDLVAVTSHDVAAFLESMLEGGLSVATVTRRYRSLGQFYGWLRAKRVVPVDPMTTVPVPVPEPRGAGVGVTPGELAALLGACSDANTSGRHGRIGSFEARRDTAIVLLLMTTGMTASEVIGVDVADVRLDRNEFRVRGRSERLIALLPLPTDALGKYFVEREGHRHASATSLLWLGERGALTSSGLRQLLERRSSMAGIRRIRSSDFRRSFASESLGRGMPEQQLAELGGWGSVRSVRRYGPDTAATS